jgi:hypothetical protein
MRVPINHRQQRIADLLEELNRNRWLVRNGHRAYGETSVRRVVGVHTSRPSARPRGSGKPGGLGGPRSSSVGGVFGLALLFMAAFWLSVFGLVWLAIQVLQWVGNLVGGKI